MGGVRMCLTGGAEQQNTDKRPISPFFIRVQVLLLNWIQVHSAGPQEETFQNRFALFSSL